MFGNKVLLNWKEPRHALNFVKNRSTWQDWTIPALKLIGKFALGGAMLAAIILIIVASIRHESGTVDVVFLPILIFVGAAVVLGLLAVLVTLLDLKISPDVSVREKDILVIAVSGAVSVSYKDIESFEIIRTKIDEEEFNVLEIKHLSGDTSGIEIAQSIETQNLIEILKSKNIRFIP